MSRVLILEDEDVIRHALRRLLERHHYEVAEAATVSEALRYDLRGFDLIIADLRLPGGEGTEIIHHAGEVPVLIMTSYASVRSAVESMKQGAVDYISKPFDHGEMLALIESIIAKHARLSRQNAALKQDLQRDFPVTGMIGRCSAMQEVFARIQRVAPVDMTVLITGESGTGKELVARALHEHSPRKEEPIIVVNCAAIPESLMESELFGHEKGAFTGAHERRAGLAAAANGGTLFLDEIGELPLPAQARLLRLLETQEVRPVGATHSKRVDIRLVAATNRNLPERVAAGEFRQDLYYRLKVMEIHLPPLRERGEDLIALAEFFLDQAGKRLHRPGLRFGVEALAAIRAYPWPGNVRELKNAIERAVILCEGAEIGSALLGIPEAGCPAAAPATAAAPDPQLSLDDYFRHFVLTHQDKLSETEIARRLGISRKALWERRQRMGIPRP
ncbi:MAG TPA: sigma-54 dependent transcriptional regulator [Candidatus Competibacteraceae bacterium]|nr:sigma-54 dependent transcriptional regulator [Candidatus Competibacteraceae bacterium]